MEFRLFYNFVNKKANEFSPSCTPCFKLPAASPSETLRKIPYSTHLNMFSVAFKLGNRNTDSFILALSNNTSKSSPRRGFKPVLARKSILQPSSRLKLRGKISRKGWPGTSQMRQDWHHPGKKYLLNYLFRQDEAFKYVQKPID